MNHDHDIPQPVRRIVLPNGRTIEVIGGTGPSLAPRELHVCPACTSRLVQAADWTETGEGRWVLTLQCPNCTWRETGSYSGEQIDDLEDRLEDGLAELIADLQSLSEANMTADVERFAAALNADLILPEDF